MVLRYVLIVGLVVLSFGAGRAVAHSFDVAIVVPLSDPMAADALAGFRVATRERDGHAGEESDGHLGGLDVYILPVDAAAGAGGVSRAAGAADIALVIGPDNVWQALRRDISGSGVPVIRPGALPEGSQWPAVSGTLSAPVASFIARFEAEFGRAPSLAAAQGYNAARRIDLAVRRQGGVDNGQALADALAASQSGIDW